MNAGLGTLFFFTDFFAGAGFFFLYLPWGLSPRTLNFSHYLFEAIPYACLALAIFLDEAWDGRHPLVPRSYLALAAALFLLFLPPPQPEPDAHTHNVAISAQHVGLVGPLL